MMRLPISDVVLNVWMSLISIKTRVLGLSPSDDLVILAWVVLTQYHRVTDIQTQTDRQTDSSYYSTLHSKLTYVL